MTKFAEKIEHSSDKDIFREMVIETDFQNKRKRKIKKLASEECVDEKFEDLPMNIFKVEIFYCVMDRVTQTIQIRFMKHTNLYLDIAMFDPKRFK